MAAAYVPHASPGSTLAGPPLAVRAEVHALRDELVANRRWFHAHPELAFQEHATAARVAQLLRGYGITELWEGVGRTGVVALIRGGAPGPCVALRADMDALPVPETADVPYRSVHEGVMHACGHDGHMAGLLAAARVLHARRAGLAGVVKLIFQPAEEGHGGARAMLADGVLGAGAFGPAVDCIYGLHIWSYQPLGALCCEHGPVMAASDRFEIDVRGRGGHGAAPQGTVDAIVEAAHLVTALQTVVARNKDPLEAGVLTVGKIAGGFGYNVIADSVKLLGTCRSFTPDTQALIERRMREVCCGVAATFGGEVALDYVRGYPPTVNAYPEHVDAVKAAGAAVVGAARTGYPQRTMGAEDMSYFLNAVPGAFFFVGAALPGDARPHHKSVFDFDEDALLVGASVFVELVERTLAAGVEAPPA